MSTIKINELSSSERSKSLSKIILRRISEAVFEDAFELTGHGRINTVVLITSGLMMLNVTMESLGMGYVTPAAVCELELESQHMGIVNSSTFIGIIATSFLWGYLGDRFGRRAVMLPAMVASAFASVASSFSTSWVMLFALRVLTGCLVSASSATVYAYLGEMQTSAHRAAAIAWGSGFISFAFMILPGLAWIVIPGEWSFSIGFLTVSPWRVFIWSWCVPGLIAAVIFKFLPESPRYVLAARGPERALSVLNKMHAWNYGKTKDYPIRRIAPPASGNTTGFAGAIKNISYIFKPPLLRCVIISYSCMFILFVVASGLYSWVPYILNNIMRNTNDEKYTVCEIIERKLMRSSETFPNYRRSADKNSEPCKVKVSVAVFPISMSMGLVFAIVYFAIGFFINRVGKRILYCGIIFVCGMALVAAVFVSQKELTVVLLILTLCAGCAGSILAAIAVDIFPTCLRAMAICLMYMVGRAGAAVGSYLLGATLDTHCRVALCTIGLSTSGSTLLMAFWPDRGKVRSEMESRGLTY